MAKSAHAVAHISLRRVGHPARALDWVPKNLFVFFLFSSATILILQAALNPPLFVCGVLFMYKVSCLFCVRILCLFCVRGVFMMVQASSHPPPKDGVFAL